MKPIQKACSIFLCLLPLLGCQPTEQVHVYSGTIEGQERLVQSEAGGILIKTTAEEGQSVKENDILARLDDRDEQLRIKEAKAAVAIVQAKLDESGAGTRPEKINEAFARVEQAHATTGQAVAKQNATAAQLKILQAKKAELSKLLESARSTVVYQQNRLKRAQSLLEAGASSRQEVDTLQEAVNQAQEVVNDLIQQGYTVDAQINQAQQEVEAARAARDSSAAAEKAAQANLDLLRTGDTNYTVQGLLAQKEQTESLLEQMVLQKNKKTITAPESGIIIRQHFHKGEVIKPGATLYTLLQANRLEVVIYVPEAELNRVKLGQTAQIKVDAYPDRTFAGNITKIASKGEFTPKNVQTPEERTKIVFAVTIRLTEGLDQVKPGMPADVTLTENKAGGK
ncbi:HlyD family secretion protein [Aneurinibacillus soli]|uniref:Putative efflux pump membrane fusion protein n=1 Tax=Aneurinibacillus soli TaxID=1500254 RepID=A0A0U4WLY7_9BACL|nr:efflux RND transporter periplasmic adaptor subunit [Aneurinibacillus soli]PYE59891.1 HlyD family secretion protein [Aneurinibacillus soli]BAU29387.1 putative efflux pump membrane fusion protein [Aneurinibacillus soli]